MNRRTLLAGLGAATVGGLAGCTQFGADSSGSGTDFSTYDGTPTTVEDIDLPVPKSELSRGAPKDAIPAITDPAFGTDWTDEDATLSDEADVIGVERDGTARAYPLAILDWHEIVNDTLGGPLLVTFCPLCGSAIVAERRVDGEPTIFGVSGYLYRSDLVMYDRRTGSLWSQILATAIRGEKTGSELTLVPFTMTTWGAWREEHPDGEVLLPPPKSNTVTGETSRNYDRDPYSGYSESRRVGIGNNDETDGRLHPKTSVIGVTADGNARAYPLDTVDEEGVVNDTVGSLPVVVAADPDGTLVAYEGQVDGTTLTFTRADRRHLSAGGSRWRILTGTAVDGPHEGTTLTRANDRSQMFWFAWADFNPGTAIYGK